MVAKSSRDDVLPALSPGASWLGAHDSPGKLPARLVAPAGLPPPPGLPLVDTFGGGSDADVESESKASGSESGEGEVNYKNLVTWALCWLQTCGS